MKLTTKIRSRTGGEIDTEVIIHLSCENCIHRYKAITTTTKGFLGITVPSCFQFGCFKTREK